MAGCILVVDDERDIRDTIAELLEEEGFAVEEAGDGAEALAKARDCHPAVVLLDLMMPGMNGWEFRREQMQDQALSDIPVVLVSGAGDVQHEARQLGARAFLVKPFRSGQLLSTLASAGV